jgi:hypothetical protein
MMKYTAFCGALLILAFALFLALQMHNQAITNKIAIDKKANTNHLLLISPKPSALIKGTLNFQVQIEVLRDLFSIEYKINGHSLSGPITFPPYDFQWNSAEAWDGPASVQAIARNAVGEVLAESDIVPITIANSNASIKIISPDFSQTLRGKLKWEVVGTRPDGLKDKPIGYMFFVDGQLQGGPFYLYSGTPFAIDLDTTRFVNGIHELYVVALATEPLRFPPIVVQSPVIIDNGHMLRDVRSRWQTLYLAPGETAKLVLRAIYTDGVEEPFRGEAEFISSAPNIASVDRTGTVKAQEAGVAHVVIKAIGHVSTVRVVVDEPHGFAHFSRDGHILTEYDADRSFFVRTLFNLSPSVIAHEHAASRGPELIAQLRAAAINALTTGFYLNPADMANPPSDFASWRNGWEVWWGSQGWAGREFPVVLTGDDIARTCGEMFNSITNRWAPQAIKYAIERVRQSRPVICIEMLDEVLGWGDTPRPNDGRWQKMTPPLPDDAFVQLMRIMNAIKERPPISWPVAGLDSAVKAHNWMGDPAFADYSSIFWTYPPGNDFRAYPYGASLGQEREGMDRNVLGWQPILQRRVPSLMLVSVAGAYYKKLGSGNCYIPGQDELLAQGVRPVSSAAEVMYAAAMGMAGVRAYNYDWFFQKDLRNGPVGSVLQTGSDPFEVNTDVWQAMAAAFNLIQRIEPYLLQPQMSAIDLGPTIVTGARAGARGRLLIAINFSEGPQKAQVDLGPYLGKARWLVRYRLKGAKLSTEIVSSAQLSDSHDLVTMDAGEAIVWVSTDKRDRTPPAISLITPLADSRVAGDIWVRARVEAVPDGPPLDRVELFVDPQPVINPPKSRVPVATVKVSQSQDVEFHIDCAKFRPGIWHAITAIAYDSEGSSSEARVAVNIVYGR